jgi:hypothetical protein
MTHLLLNTHNSVHNRLPKDLDCNISGPGSINLCDYIKSYAVSLRSAKNGEHMSLTKLGLQNWVS